MTLLAVLLHPIQPLLAMAAVTVQAVVSFGADAATAFLTHFFLINDYKIHIRDF